MSTYCVGDIHGCYDELELLLKQISFNPATDFLLTTGDVIGRGPKPVETLNFLLRNRDRIVSVLGNHDLSLLRNYHLYSALKDQQAKQQFLNNLKSTELAKILHEPNGHEMLEYLRHCPMTYLDRTRNIFISHAGLSPEWSIADAVENGEHVENVLRSEYFGNLMENMFSDRQRSWAPIMNEIRNRICREQLKDPEKIRHAVDYEDGSYDFMALSPSLELDRCIYTINALTRMRFCHSDLSLDFDCKDKTKKNKNQDLSPWYKFHNPKLKKSQLLIFGHWAALEGRDPSDSIIALDTGCVWNGALSLINIDEPHKRYSVKACH